MHVHFLDTYSHLSSPVHRVPAAVKLFVAVAIIVTGTLLPARPAVVAAFVAPAAFALLMVAAASQVPGTFLLRRVIFLEPVVLGAALLALFRPHGGAAFAVLAARSTLCLFTVILLANTTSFADILRVLRWVRVPAILITTLALMYRYLYVLLDESRRMQRARASRSFTGGASRARGNAATVAGHLLVRANARAARTYAAMCARGWQ